MEAVTLFLVIICLSPFLSVKVDGQSPVLTCKSCNRVASLEQCTQSVICSGDEVCYMDEIITPELSIVYTSGCRSKIVCSGTLSSEILVGKRNRQRRDDLIACSRCCDTVKKPGQLDCNARLCGIKYANTIASRCYLCDSRDNYADQGNVDRPIECLSETSCDSDEACGVQRVDISGRDEHIYNCLPKSLCTLLTHEVLYRKEECEINPDPKACANNNAAGKRASTTLCTACCGDGLCNSGSCEQVIDRLYALWKGGVLDFNTLKQKGSLVTTSTTVVTTPTTPTTTLTTTPTTVITQTTLKTTTQTTATTPTTLKTTSTTLKTTTPTTATTPTTLKTTTPTTATTPTTLKTTTPTTATTPTTLKTTTPTTATTPTTLKTTTPTTATTPTTLKTTTPTTATTPTTLKTTPTTLKTTTPTTATTNTTLKTTTQTTATTPTTLKTTTPTTLKTTTPTTATTPTTLKTTTPTTATTPTTLKTTTPTTLKTTTPTTATTPTTLKTTTPTTATTPTTLKTTTPTTATTPTTLKTTTPTTATTPTTLKTTTPTTASTPTTLKTTTPTTASAQTIPTAVITSVSTDSVTTSNFSQSPATLLGQTRQDVSGSTQTVPVPSSPVSASPSTIRQPNTTALIG